MRLLISMLFLSGLLSPAVSEEKTSIAVMDLRVEGVENPDMANTLTDLIAAEISRLGSYTVINRDDIRALMAHAAAGQALSSEETGDLAEIGTKLGAARIISGSIRKTGETYTISLKAVDTGRAKITGRVYQIYQGPESGLVKIMKKCVPNLIKKDKKIKRRSVSDRLTGEKSVRIAVMDLAARQGVSAQATASLTDLVTNEISRMPKYEVINKDDIRVMLEHVANKQLLNCDDTKCLAVIGGALGVDYIFSGNIGKIGDIYVINLKVINIDKAEVLTRLSTEFRGNESELVEKIKHAVNKLFDEKRLFRKKLLRWSMVGGAALSAGAGGYFAWQGNDIYDNKYMKYLESGDPGIGNSNAIELRNDVKRMDLYRNISLAVTSAFSGAAWYLFRKK